MKIPAILWLLIGIIVVILSIVVFSTSHIFFWVGLVFMIIGIFQIVSGFILKDNLQTELQRLEKMQPKFGRPCSQCGFPGRVEDSFCSKCGGKLPHVKVHGSK